MQHSMHSRHSRPGSAQQGLTLVELMVVVAIMSILAMLSAQFGFQWSNSAKVTQTQASLQQAYAIAKSTALQNYRAQAGGSAAAVLCLSSAQLNVFQGGSCSGSAVWTRPVASGVAIQFGSPAATALCIALSNAAIPLSTASAGTCATNLTYSITAGSANASKNLY